MKSITQLEMLRQTIIESDDDDFGEDMKMMSTNRKSDRKKRRGVIEKRRRDRINTSLSELKRLVPSAYEKQGSTKLEKAEILQLTVDHLQLLNAKGLTGYGVDPSSLALDYRTVGFRECVAEVARYLAAVEGMDLQDPLRMRMLGHLEAYSAQRDVTAKANLQTFNSWGTWSRFHNSNTTGTTSLGTHAKYSSYHHGLSSAKSGLSLFTSNPLSHHPHQQTSTTTEVDSNAYLAASRLSSAIGFGHHHHHTSPITNTGLCHMTSQTLASANQQQQQLSSSTTGSCHLPTINSGVNSASSHLVSHGYMGHNAASMKLRGFGSDLAY